MELFADHRPISHPAAREIIAILDRGHYVGEAGVEISIAAAQAEAEAGTMLHTPEQLAELRERERSGGPATRIEVVHATTQQAAHALAREAAVVVLNFASARNPGGGFPGGAKAQEEELCRCSGLYRALLHAPAYYHSNRAQRSLLYTDHAIHSPRVPFFRLAASEPWLPEPLLLSVITAPAPNAGAIARERPHEAHAIASTFERRWANVLAIAEHHGHRALVLGAWGCGA
ncbi:MAG TPA: TIGR02452 family protein, partial [Nannocystaceae bacterium]|nr:TIGR02452 family protein [Nannocystaceae bacterium]